MYWSYAHCVAFYIFSISSTSNSWLFAFLVLTVMYVRSTPSNHI